MADVSALGWSGVATSLLLVVLVAAVTYRERLHLTRELAIASVRAAIQLIAVGALLVLLFAHTGLPGALAWVVVMILIAVFSYWAF